MTTPTDAPIKKKRRPRTQQALARAVFKRHDPVDMACELLAGDGSKGASVKARIWEKLIEYEYGKPRPQEPEVEEEPPIIWDFPSSDRTGQ